MRVMADLIIGTEGDSAPPSRQRCVIDIVQAIIAERDRQTVLQREGRFLHTAFSSQLSHAERAAILGEEFGEVCRAVVEDAKLANDRHGKTIAKELTQVAAVCLAWLEYLADA
jgi:NTP pyrophosphatase (non-canonical NTP hydrolase)